MFNSHDALESLPHSDTENHTTKRPAQEKHATPTIQERELRTLAITRNHFEKLPPAVQRQVKRFLEIDKRNQQEAHKQCDQKEKQEEQRQMRRGFCDVLKPSPTGYVKTDLAINKNAIFVVNSFDGDWRECTRKVKTPGGETVTQKITVGRVVGDKRGRGVLKQKHEQLMYGLFDLWARTGAKLATVDGCPRGCITTSAHQLVKCIYAGVNADAYKHVRSTLRDLAAIPITIKNAYTRHGVREVEFTIIGEVEWNDQREEKGENATPPGEAWGQSDVRILFSRFVTENFLHGYVKDFPIKSYNELGGGTRQGPRKTAAQGLYRLLDTELATKKAYSISLANLAKNLGMHGYRHKSKRREKFGPAVAAVNGRPLRSGSCRVRVQLRLSQDGSDYILAARCEGDSAGDQEQTARAPGRHLVPIPDWAARVKPASVSVHTER